MIFLDFSKNINLTGKKFAGFDLDFTIIKPKSGKKFSTNSNDWIWLFPSVREKLIEISKNKEYIITIFTNQLGIEKGKVTIETIKDKFNKIHKDININFIVLIADKDDVYRKPRVGMWKFLKEKGLIKEGSFYVGDAAGRLKYENFPKDHSDSDRKFADNIKVPFYTPEVFFLYNKDINYERKWEYNGYNLKYIRKRKNNIKFNNQENNLVLVMGFPGSGKTYLSKKLSKKYNFEHLSQDKDKGKLLNKLTNLFKQKKSIVIEGLFYSELSRKKYLDLANKNGYDKYIIKLTSDFDLSYHLNYYRFLKKGGSLVPKVVYHTYKKYYEEPNNKDYDNVFYYHPKLKDKINKYYLY